MRNFFLAFVFFNTHLLFSQSEVSVIASGSGSNKEECVSNALRSAVEQTFGTFITANSTVVNDVLVEDNIQSVSKGFIKKYFILNEALNTVTLKAIVSLNSIQSYCHNKGVSVEFNGEMFGFDVKQQELNRKGELLAFENLLKMCKDFLPKCFDYEVVVRNPVELSLNEYYLPVGVKVQTNKNIKLLFEQIELTLEGLDMKDEEVLTYTRIGKDYHEFSFGSGFSKKSIYGGRVYLAKKYRLRSRMNPFFDYFFTIEYTRPSRYYSYGIFNQFKLKFEGTPHELNGYDLEWGAPYTPGRGTDYHRNLQKIFWPELKPHLPDDIHNDVENTNIWFSREYDKTLIIPKKSNVTVAYYVLGDKYNNDRKNKLPSSIDFISKIQKVSITNF
jgi:hypothetical protein